jgi:hypothetical protein
VHKSKNQEGLAFRLLFRLLFSYLYIWKNTGAKMAIKQISVFLENATGRFWEVTGVFAKTQISIRVIFIADIAEFGFLRLIAREDSLTAIKSY